jgi:hypothetical protein
MEKSSAGCIKNVQNRNAENGAFSKGYNIHRLCTLITFIRNEYLPKIWTICGFDDGQARDLLKSGQGGLRVGRIAAGAHVAGTKNVAP